MLKPIQDEYDYVFIDCPPAIGMLTVNALVASRFVLVPLQAEFLPLPAPALPVAGPRPNLLN